MIELFATMSPVAQALVATCFTWGVTALGASTVLFTRNVSRRLLDGMLGFAAGVMIAASYWSLLAPAIEMAHGGMLPAWVPAVSGFVLGAIFLRGIDLILPHLHFDTPVEQAEGIKTHWQRTALLIMAITLHNIPEGLAVGVAFGAAANGHDTANLTGAVALAIGIGLQNFPEGLAVAAPLRREGVSPLKSFWYGQLSAVVEPIAGIVGAGLVTIARPLLPYALSFAAGAMIFVVVEEAIPESQRGGHTDLATLATIGGFAVMMLLDVALG
ncbi:Zinc transporter ZupT [Anaerolineae bacterium]|nr:Zinc transporter ZupT [Anaerolineae bacterium]